MRVSADDPPRLVREVFPRILRGPVALARDLVAPVFEGARVLELGAGFAAVSAELARAAPLAVVSVDLEKPCLVADAAASRRVRAAVGALPFASGAFDVVIGHFVLGRRLADRARLRELVRVTAKNGVVVATALLPASFVELADLLVEAAEHEDLPGLRGAVLDGREERAELALAAARLAEHGVDVEGTASVETVVEYQDGPAVVQDPFVRDVVIPALLPEDAAVLVPPVVLARISRAIDTYFDGRPFPLRTAVGVVRGVKR